MGLDSHFIHTCTINRAGESKDAYGNIKLYYGPLHLDVPCRLVERSQRVWNDEKTASMAVTTLTLLVGTETDLVERDQITDVEDEEGNVDTRRFVVRSLLKRRGAVVRHKSAMLEVVG